MADYEERKPQGQQRTAAAPQIAYIPPLPIPDQAALHQEQQQQTLQRYQHFFATPDLAQRSSAAPVLEAAQVQRTLVLQRQQSQLALQRQIEALSEGLPPDALQAALRRQAEQAGVPALPPIFSGPTRSQPSYADHAQRYAHEAVSLQRQADQHSGFVAMSAWPTIQQRAAQDLAQRFRSDLATQRYAELGRSLALVQRQPQGKQVARVVLQRLPAGERPMVQRALDEAEQEHQQYGEQDRKALELHALQRKLTEEDALAPVTLPRGSGQPLPLAVQRRLAVGLNIPGEHLRTVRVHADPAAHSFAKSVQAIAATTGTDIFFQRGKLDTESAEGQELLAHEVTHTYQQAQGKVTGKGIDPDPALEQEARLAGKAFAQNASAKNIPSVLKAPVADKFASLNTSARTVQRLADDQQKHNGETQANREAQPEQQVKKLGVIKQADGANLHEAPKADSQNLIPAPLPVGTKLFVLSQTADGWSKVSTPQGKSGYVQTLRVTTDLPDPGATLIQVGEGMSAVGVAERFYKPLVKPGQDLRFYVNVLEHVNAQRGTGAFQGGQTLKSGALLWVPGGALAQSLAGQVGSGSISGGRWAQAKETVGHGPGASILRSVLESPQYAKEVLGEAWEAVKEHWPAILGTTAALVSAELLVGALAAAPEPTTITKFLAVGLQGLITAVAGVGAITTGAAALREGEAWLRQAWTAHGDAGKLN